MKWYDIYFKGDTNGNPRAYRGTIKKDKFEGWLENHNRARVSGPVRLPYEFELEEVKESKDEQ